MEHGYECSHCGSSHITIEKTNNGKFGVYYSDCNAWISWVKSKDAKKINEELAREGNSHIKIVRRSGIIMLRCANCNTLLTTSNTPMPVGQFDLAKAKYCPSCGKKVRK